jgi:hypothetical protein
MNGYSPQVALDRINNQIAELESMKKQLQQPVQPTNLTQNFQISPTNKEIIKYANNIDEVSRDLVIGDTPYFSKDMSVVWIKNTKGEIKTYELNEIIPKDDKDLKIELLLAEIKELKEGIKNGQSDTIINDAIENEKSSDVSNDRTSKKKSK